MKNYLFFAVLSLSFLSNPDAPAQDLAGKHSEAAVSESQWKSFRRYDLKLGNREVRIVVPNNPLTGNPWVWRARFPDWHTETDSILLSEGFHVVYINANNEYGSPKAMMAWDSLYNYVTENYALNKKVALEGVSRGGLFIYNWAKRNPEKVSCIYGEAPVCDFKSWPGGFGEGVGSAEDWNRLKKEYGFHSDSEAKAYSVNLPDNLQDLAAAKVPVLHLISLNDKIVPPEENTFPLINEYIRLGGVATVVPCTSGEQSLQGHHFPIESPRLVVDFITYYSLQSLPLESSRYHQMRNGLQNSEIQFERYKKGRIAFLGGSITYNKGWRDSLCAYFLKRFPDTEFEFINAGIPSMGSTPGAYRLERDVLSHGRIDLLFLEAAVNDATNGRSSREEIRAMEGIIRHLRSSNPDIDIVMMYFVDPDKMHDYRDGKVPEVIMNHEKVASRYHIPAINLAKEVTDRIDHGEFTWKEDFKNLHPSPFGQGIYAHSMIQLLDDAFSGTVNSDDKITANALPDKLDRFCYDGGRLIDVSTVSAPEGWHLDTAWSPDDGTRGRPNYTGVPMLISETPGKILHLHFTGTAVGIAVAAGQDAGIIEYRIDKTQWQKTDLYTRWSKHLHLPWYYTLAGDLPSGAHDLEIKLSSGKNAQSNGHACRIRYFYVNE